jgi:chromosome segregation ATPase
MQEILITGLVSLGTAIGGFFVGRRKSIADAQHIEINNVHQAIEIWRKVAQEMSSKVASLEHTISELKCENRKMSDEIDELRRQLRKLTTDNRRQISKIENKINKNDD